MERYGSCGCGFLGGVRRGRGEEDRNGPRKCTGPRGRTRASNLHGPWRKKTSGGRARGKDRGYLGFGYAHVLGDRVT
eukprot:scaffold99_cov422-Pavlova_lutheri.AAC.6